MYSLNGLEASSKYSMSVSMYRGGGRGYGRLRSAPPDLPSLLLDARIVYLGMPVSHIHLINKALNKCGWKIFFATRVKICNLILCCIEQMVPAVTELLVAQFMWLDYDDPSKPIYLYINSSGTQVSSAVNIYLFNYCLSYWSIYSAEIARNFIIFHQILIHMI